MKKTKNRATRKEKKKKKKTYIFLEKGKRFLATPTSFFFFLRNSAYRCNL